jgi:hypothetical protein
MGWDFHSLNHSRLTAAASAAPQLGDVDPMPLNGRGPPPLISRPSFSVAIAVSSQGYASQ